MTNLVKAKISTVVDKQLPEFVRDDHKTFVKFLQAYYDFMESKDTPSGYPNPGYILRNVDTARDIDNTVDKFLEYLSNEIMIDIPKNILSDKRLLAKHINQLYTTKGTSQSYELLFRILFNEDIDVYYPSEDIFRASDGKYNTNTVLKIVETHGNAFNLVGQTIIQPQVWQKSKYVLEGELVYYSTRIYRVTHEGALSNTFPPVHTSGSVTNGSATLHFVSTLGYNLNQTASVASAVVESVSKYTVGFLTIAELNLNYESIVGEFLPNAPLYGVDNYSGSDIIMEIKPVISKTIINNSGSYYNISDRFQIFKQIQYSEGTVFSADDTTHSSDDTNITADIYRVPIYEGGAGLFCEVGGIGRGSIDGVLIENQGSGYQIGDEVYFDDVNTGGSGAKAIVSEIEIGSILLEDDTLTEFKFGVDGTSVTADSTSVSADYNGGIGYLISEQERKFPFDEIYTPETFAGTGHVTTVTLQTDVTNVDANNVEIYIIDPDGVLNTSYAQQLQNPLVDYSLSLVNGSTVVTFKVAPFNGSRIEVYNKSLGVGAIKQITMLSKGAGYSKLPSVYIASYIKLVKYKGNYTIGETIYGNTTSGGLNIPLGKVVAWNKNNLILQYIPTSFSFTGCTTVTGKTSLVTSSIDSVREHNTTAVLFSYGENIGAIDKINVTGIGVNYTTIPKIVPPANVMITRQWRENLSDKNLNDIGFVIGEEIKADADLFKLEVSTRDNVLLLENGDKIISENTALGTCLFFDSSTNILSIKTDNRVGIFNADQIIEGSRSGARARIFSINQAEVAGYETGIGNYNGTFINTDGMISESSKHMIDDYYYQDFSYVIKSTQSIENYRTAVKKLLHPTGMMLFGQVSVKSSAVKSYPTTDLIDSRITKKNIKEFQSIPDLIENTTVVRLEQWVSAGITPHIAEIVEQ